MKKADLSINIVIIAAIALLVLIVIIAIFAGKINIFAKGHDQTTTDTKEGVCGSIGRCVADASECTTSTLYRDWIDCAQGQTCCLREWS